MSDARLTAYALVGLFHKSDDYDQERQPKGVPMTREQVFQPGRLAATAVGLVRSAARLHTVSARILAAALVLGAVCLPASASAIPTATLKAALRPERLGAGTTIKFAFSIAYTGETPSPLRVIELQYPANLGIATSGLGLSTCRATQLIGHGPPGCPSTSVIGYGSGLVEVPFGFGNVSEGVRLTTFMAPLHDGHLELLFYAEAERPISAELIFPGVVLPSAAPFGGDLATDVPLVPTLPEAPDAILAKFATTIGPEHITYWEYSKGHYIPYHPRGILLPKRCPRGGFPFAAAFAFENGAHTNAHTVVRCPR